MMIHQPSLGALHGSSSGPRFRTGLRTQTGPLTGSKGLAHMVSYLKMADGGSPSDDSIDDVSADVAPAINRLQSQSRGNDTQLAHISPGEVQLLDYLHGGTQRNPSTGLPEYGWLGDLMKGLVRAGATIAGGMVAGPLGAAAGAGLSNKLTGGSWSDALKAAAISGIGGEVTQGVSSGSWDPTQGYGSGATAANAAKSTAQDLAHQEGLNEFAQTAAGTPVGNMAASAAGQTPLDATMAQPGIGSQLLSAAKSGPGIASALGALSMPFTGAASAAAPTTNDAGPHFSVQPIQRAPTPYMGDLTKYGYGPMHQWYDNINPAPVFTPAGAPGGVDYTGTAGGYAKGGTVRGVPGFAGGGPMGLAAPSLNALAQAAQLGYQSAAKGGVSGAGGGQDDTIPARLSSGEYVMDADTVSALGDGSTEAGVQKLDAFRQKLRTQKRSAPASKIPPKAKGIGSYLKISPRSAG